ncbi:MAG: TIGR01906 family membrane protein [Dehalococcoidales bacterium]|nr:TIGR01906 family membrane protein [Dehalococcoidales bacterium]
MKIVKIITHWLFVLCLPVMLFTASVSAAANCIWLYEYGFDKYEAGQVTGLEPSQLTKVAQGLIGYWNSGDKTFNITVTKDGQPFTVFNQREVGHLKDVKAIFQLVYRLLMGTGIYVLIFAGIMLFWWKDKRRLGLGLLWGSGLSIALMVALGLAAIIDFHWLFWQFHIISFANDLWLLNPATDYLIMLFPEGFWFDAAIYCSVAKVIAALILGGVGWWLWRKYKNILA